MMIALAPANIFLAGGNKLRLVESNIEGESVLGRQSRNVCSRCPVCNRWMLVTRLGLFCVPQ